MRRATIEHKKDKKLFIIGNGFDLHHGLETTYKNFSCFLKKENPGAFDACNKFLGFPQGQDSIWRNFEESLGAFSPETLIDKCQSYFNDHNPHESGEASWEAKKFVDLIAITTKQSFQKWISSLSPKEISGKKLCLPRCALYLNFNYTKTLEKYYDIQPSNICHIHGTSENPEIGHGVHPSDVLSSNPAPIKPARMTAEQEELWQGCMNDEYSLSLELACAEIDEYWSRSFKDVNLNIENNKSFFKKCNNISSITIMGHSLSKVDMPYFEEIKRKADPDATWKVSFYDSKDKESFKSILICLGIIEKNITTFQL